MGEKVVILFVAPTCPTYDTNAFYICDIIWWEIALTFEGKVERFPVIINPDQTNEVVRAQDLDSGRWEFIKILEIGQDFLASEYIESQEAEKEYSRLMEAKKKIAELDNSEAA